MLDDTEIIEWILETDEKDRRQPFVRYDLVDTRTKKAQGTLAGRKPLFYQEKALSNLAEWYEEKNFPRGALMVLPTGGGKTFTATRFICENPLFGGYKVLWLAERHHLLDQAQESFNYSVSEIRPPNSTLNIRVVSGASWHCDVPEIEPSDDVLISSVRTASQAWEDKRSNRLQAFINAAKGRLFVVFDEAHHVPAPSYRRLLLSLREHCLQMHLLGLTGTPIFSVERLRGWLSELFPQGILYQISLNELIAARVLSEPELIEIETKIPVEIDEGKIRKWEETGLDLDKRIVTQLASNKKRNSIIVKEYVKGKEKWGKTIIFADRRSQCIDMQDDLNGKRGIRAGMIFHRQDADENERVLQDFRDGNLDVIINVRILTEGVDIPDAQTVFLTRQTTSRILMNQMVGRVLRGPALGGTEKAYLVSFVDNWKHLINWASWDKERGGTDDGDRPNRKRQRQWISIHLIQLAARIMRGELESWGSLRFLAFVPVGWYLPSYEDISDRGDESEEVQKLVMVFDYEQTGYEQLIKKLVEKSHNGALGDFANESLEYEDVAASIEDWHDSFFLDSDLPAEASHRSQGIFRIARHVGQKGEAPIFIRFEEREDCDLGRKAEYYRGLRVPFMDVVETIKDEYRKKDLWQAIYGSEKDFVRLMLTLIVERPEIGEGPTIRIECTTKVSRRVIDDNVINADAIMERDGNKCLCCGDDRKRVLQIDHIRPRYYEGSGDPENLQTLCRKCNGIKGKDEINFIKSKPPLNDRPLSLPDLALPRAPKASELLSWEMFVRRTINFFYRCGAVRKVRIGKRGKDFYHWQVELAEGLNPRWIMPHLATLLETIADCRAENGLLGPRKLTVASPGRGSVFGVID